MNTLKVEWHLDGQKHDYTVTAEKSTRIGRSLDCDIVLPFPTVSREHARISREGRTFYLQNISRTNQVRLDDHVQLSEGQRVSLQPGDGFKLGPLQFQVVQPPEPVKQAGTPKIICSACGRKVAYIPNGVCSECGAPLAEGVTMYSA